MAFPKIEHCLLCDDIRQERGRKLTILGFYGIAPKVRILVQDLTKRLERISFILLGGPGEGKYKLLMRLLDEDNNPVLEPKEAIEIDIQKSLETSILTLGLGGVKFPKTGEYRFELQIDGKVCYTTSFEVGQGKAEDFA